MRRLFSLGSIAAAYTKMDSSPQVVDSSPQVVDSSPKVDADINASPADPEVVEFFKYFPEPYKQHAIERYSSRDGLYRWKIFRQMDMEEEKQSALRGIFLEDIRRTEELAKEQEIADRKEYNDERKRHFHEREVPAWEQWVLKYIPVQPGETMKLKLTQASLTSVTGVLFLLVGLTCFRDPKFPRFRAYTLLVTTPVLCISFQIVAFARLMDLGLFDRSVDDRHVVEKLIEEFQKNFEDIGDFGNKGSTRR